MKKKIVAAIIFIAFSISLISCGKESDADQEAFEQRMEELDEDISNTRKGLDGLSNSISETADRIDSFGKNKSEHNSTLDNFGITVDEFIPILTNSLSQDGIFPTDSKDMETFYFLYFEGENENNSLLITMDDNRFIESMNFDAGIKNFDSVCKSCIEILNINIGADKLMKDLKSDQIIIEQNFSFDLSEDGLIILSSGGKSTISESEDLDHDWRIENNNAGQSNSQLTVGQENALRSAKNYLDYYAFSRNGLISQLEYEGFSSEDATYAVDNCGADWNEQAVKKAQDYVNMMSFSRSGLIEQLQYEGFSADQAEYGATAVGY